MGNDGQDITLRDILGHILSLKQEMLQKFEALELKLTKRMDQLEHRMDRMEARLSSQIATIDQRLDEVEVTRLPALEAKVR